MTRDEMIDVLVEDKISEWVYAHCFDDLEEVLFSGWKGFDDYTDDELKRTIEDWIDPSQIKELLESSKRRKQEQIRTWKENERKIAEMYSK